MSENEIQVWICLNPDCKKEMDKADMKYVNFHGKCPYCWCTDFNVKIYELKKNKIEGEKESDKS